jgi:hypothetical protein
MSGSAQICLLAVHAFWWHAFWWRWLAGWLHGGNG